MFNFTDLTVFAQGGQAEYAAELFSREISKRTDKVPAFTPENTAPKITFIEDISIENKDFYKIEQSENTLKITAKTLRGLIYGYSLFLRKIMVCEDNITLMKNIEGEYSPQKKIRGHQVGYRDTPNTYDAWSYDQYFQYYLDMMAFGANTVEHNGSSDGKKRNPLMKYDQFDFLVEASALADKLDLDVSLWQANDTDESEENALKSREKLYASMPRLDYLFPPGGDPGELPADVFIDRCEKIAKVLHKSHPKAQMHPSAQAPHSIKNWGDVFCESINNSKNGIDCFILGPNHAFPVHELRKRVSDRYQMRFYPDITHNLRCEYPVNFQQDDWHFAFANTLSRESVNPRPTELLTLHRIFSPYTNGSVSYSEGVHDDLNKMVWSALEFDPNIPLSEIVEDYVRYFFPGAPVKPLTDIIFALEKNWQGAPEENPCIEPCYKKFTELKAKIPSLMENWRFVMHYFRALCDYLVQERRVFELILCEEAETHLKNSNISDAVKVLNSPYDEHYGNLRRELDYLGGKLFELIGLQLDVEHYFAKSWERGATLETIDNNITDLEFLKSKCKIALSLSGDERKKFIDILLNSRKKRHGEVYFSMALDGLKTLGTNQTGEFYMDIQGDRPFAKEKAYPMALSKAFDHFSLEAFFGGLAPDTDYELKIVYKTQSKEKIKNHKITVNDKIIYEGPRYGGNPDPFFDSALLSEDFESATYPLPRQVILNTTVHLLITEPTDGFLISELWITKANK